MKKWKRILGLGVMIGAISVPIVGYAAAKLLHIEVAVVSPAFNVDGKMINEDSFSNGEDPLPYAVNYKGTTYVPLRKLGKLMGKKIGWDEASQTIHIESSIKSVDFDQITDLNQQNVPQEIKDWLENTKEQEMTGVKTVGGTHYILIQRGMKPTTGYGVSISGVYEMNDQVVITANYRDPMMGMMQGQIIMYPSILVRMKSWPTGKNAVFALNKSDQGDKNIVAGDLSPSLTVDDSKPGEIHFTFKVKNQTEQVQTLNFENGLEYDYTVRNEWGQKIAEPTDYGLDQKHEQSVKQGEELAYDRAIKLNPGKYSVDFYLNDTKWKAHAKQLFEVK